MTPCEWIVCERTDRWAAALRVMMARQAEWLAGAPRLYEVRGVEELSARLETQPDALGLVSVDAHNLSRVLAWLAAAGDLFPGARFVALVDCADCRQDVAEALFEAGAAEVAHSPRRLQHILPLARRHALAANARPISSTADNSAMASDWPELPWQAEVQNVG